MTPVEVVDRVTQLYDASVASLQSALNDFITKGKKPDPAWRTDGRFSYPQVKVIYRPDGPPPVVSRAFGKLSEPGVYVTTITQPHFFRAYLISQLTMITNDHKVEFEVGLSDSNIPYPYVLDGAEGVDADVISPADFASYFPTPKLSQIGDEVPDGTPWIDDYEKPLALFDAARVDFSLKRLAHYTGTPIESFQRYILFTNYHRYVDAFVDWAVEEIKNENGLYKELVAPGGIRVDAKTKNAAKKVSDGPWRRHQMPAYHILGPDNASGITLVNIGVGPSNAKTITDHLAVLRPECWIMVGHCGGLRQSQRIGDYVLGHAYLRDDHVLDSVLPADIPVPPIAEIQQALSESAEIVTGDTPEALKKRLRTGTVFTTDDRNWELRYTESAKRINQSRAIAVDMESATIAANGYRMRVPYGTLLCVSDKPFHGELKLPGAANKFYERAIGEHIRIGIDTLERLASGDAKLHSRKLRAFDEPPFR
ncbi:AMP nucleosidase [Hirschia baltica]|uniref:AMP nucleosidase n=1 Tax=Hirschia baltica (strain ATCC 49814 / DSM 5838 / IFAM 1418) TaxID=582402 RepID=C6XQ10_HIRBI|nr:AMP nucleosidase [Hirschia baltica]ACT58527.1 AMP nucleosidase [Hirschia baltica ATCC 49814]